PYTWIFGLVTQLVAGIVILLGQFLPDLVHVWRDSVGHLLLTAVLASLTTAATGY
ncbi:hypothetical protein HaLaN_24534, partial [Haematococcus lacustris]